MGTALDEVNDAFHGAYDDVRTRAELDAPVLIVLADVLVLVHHKRRRELPLTPPMFTVVKSVAHAPVALHALLHRHADRTLDGATLERVAALEALLARATRDVGAESSGAADGAEPRPVDHMAEDMRAVLRLTAQMAAKAIAEKRVSAEALASFARETGAALLRLTEDATRLQLEALHARVEEAVVDLSAADRARLEVVVIGAHQARTRSYGMQYFQKRFGEKAGVEDRVAYAEAVETEEEAVALVGKRRLDRAIARAFFGDAKRLQRDVLGDAAAHVLRTMQLDPL